MHNKQKTNFYFKISFNSIKPFKLVLHKDTWLLTKRHWVDSTLQLIQAKIGSFRQEERQSDWHAKTIKHCSLDSASCMSCIHSQVYYCSQPFTNMIIRCALHLQSANQNRVYIEKLLFSVVCNMPPISERTMGAFDMQMLVPLVFMCKDHLCLFALSTFTISHLAVTWQKFILAEQCYYN